MGTAATDKGDQLLIVAGVAAHIGAHESTVRIWLRAGELPATKLGSRIGYRITRSDGDFLRRRSVIGAITLVLAIRRSGILDATDSSANGTDPDTADQRGERG
ncbi:MAG: helix-turn-helix domain-containing protein, partial [Geminicoccaceae bacterium]